MTRTLLLCSITAFLLLSCAKKIEDHIIGEWRLDVSYKKELFGRDYFQTGYENGFFTFYESGSARYVQNQDTLSGYWRSDFYTPLNRYEEDERHGSDRLKYLELYLADFNRNQIIDWRFDDFNFKNNWKCIKAVDFSLGRDRYYEFVKP